MLLPHFHGQGVCSGFGPNFLRRVKVSVLLYSLKCLGLFHDDGATSCLPNGARARERGGNTEQECRSRGWSIYRTPKCAHGKASMRAYVCECTRRS